MSNQEASRAKTDTRPRWLGMLVGWLQRRSHRRLRDRLVKLEAHEKVWALPVEHADTTNSYFIERLAEIRGDVAVVKERLSRTRPPNGRDEARG